VPTLRLIPTDSAVQGHRGEVFACAYTPEGEFLLSGGWDGQLRLWDVAEGSPIFALAASKKPVSACAVSPNGRHWLSGSMDGMLAHWEAQTQKQASLFLAHSRPISAIVFSGEEEAWATASWDGNVMLWDPGHERQGRPLEGHADIVAGCRFTPDGRLLLSWSYDGTLGLWEVVRGLRLGKLVGHTDRVTAAAISPDGRWAASGSRNGVVILWNLHNQLEVASHALGGEIRGCFFLLDGESLATLDGQGRIVLHTLPELQVQAELATRLRVQCWELAPNGSQIALGCDDGRVRFVSVEGFESVPLAVRARQTSRRQATTLERLFGRSHVMHAYLCTCPVCRQAVELPAGSLGQAVPCPHCQRPLRVSAVTATEQVG
jgi:WD40 repeat protein